MSRKKAIYLLTRKCLPSSPIAYVHKAVVVATTPAAARKRVAVGISDRDENNVWRDGKEIVVETLGNALETTEAAVHCVEIWRLLQREVYR